MEETLFDRHPAATSLRHSINSNTTSPPSSMTSSSPNAFDYPQSTDVISGGDHPIDFSVKRLPIIANGNRGTKSPSQHHATNGNRPSTPGRSVSSTADELSSDPVGMPQVPAAVIVPPSPAAPSVTAPAPAVILPANARFPPSAAAAAAAAAVDPLTFARLQGLAALAMQSQPLAPSQLLAQVSYASNPLSAVAPLMTPAAPSQAVLPVSVPVVNPAEALIAAHYRTMQMIADEQRRLVQLQQALVTGSAAASRLGTSSGTVHTSAAAGVAPTASATAGNVKLEGNGVAINNNQNGGMLTSPTTAAGVVSGSEDACNVRQTASSKPTSSVERNGSFGQAAQSPDSGNSEVPLSLHLLPSSFGDGSSALLSRKRGRSYPERLSPPRHSPREDHFDQLPAMTSGGDSAVSGSGGGRDSAYYERRRKNNEAAKRSRDARRAKEEEIAMKAAYLEQENRKLQVELVTLREEVNRLNELLFLRGPMAARAALAAAVATPAGLPATQSATGTS